MKTQPVFRILILISCFMLHIHIYAQKVFISEVMYDTPLHEDLYSGPLSHNGEYIELYNPDVYAVDISGWSLNGGTLRESFIFPNNTVISSKAYFLIVFQALSNKNRFQISALFPELSEYENTKKIVYQNGIMLNNRGERIQLRDKNGIVVDWMEYKGTSNPVTEERVLYARNGYSGHENSHKAVSLHRQSVRRDGNNNGVFHIDCWQYGTVTPFGKSLVLSGFDFEQVPSLEAEFYPSNELFIELSNLPQAELQSFINPTDNDILYGYDNAGNRITRTIFLAKANTKALKNTSEVESFTDKLDEKVITIYPNPTKGLLQIDITGFTETATGSFQVYSMSGSVIYKSKIEYTPITIDLTNQQSGAYILRINLDNKTSTWKIIKQ